MVEEAKVSNSRSRPRRGLTRRSVLAIGATAAAISGFPYVSRGFAAQTLKFWQFYSPGGGVATQDKWYQDIVKGWNDRHDVKVELVYVPNNAYMDGTKLPTAFASGAGPDLFIISPGDFLRYYNGGVLLELTPFMDQAARDDFIPSVIANRMVDGKIYGLPYEVEPMAMYYSVDAFARDRPHRERRSQDLGRTARDRQEADQRQVIWRVVRNQDLWMVQVAIASFRQQYNGSWNYIMAASTVVALPTLAMCVVFQKRIIESIKTTGIK